MITHMNHITLGVQDVNISFAFYRDVLGLTPLVKWDKGAYFLIGNVLEIENSGFWFCLNSDANRQPSACYTHYAFGVSQEDFTTVSKRIIDSGARIFKENTSEGNSLYFLDPDGYKLEIHVGNWPDRVKAKKEDEGSWKEIEWFV